MLAHMLDSYRTKDVILDENVDFELLVSNKDILKGLHRNGFKKPSPIQVKAIPVGRCGFDLIVKSKSGTGKTLVYAVVALEIVDTFKNETQVLIIVPTREIVIQVEEVLLSIGRYIEGIQIRHFIGGFPLDVDRTKCQICHIAVGTPGRIKHLINEGILKIDSVNLFVLDEVDKLMECSFLNDINEIYNYLPDRTQIITTSATYTNELKLFLQKYMLSPLYIGIHNNTPFLRGLKQFTKVVQQHSNVVQQMKIKTEEILKIISKISFTQCIIFTNYQVRAESISHMLNQKGWVSTYISAARPQTERIAAVKDFKKLNFKIILSTDLTARGIDVASVDLVINYDVPHDATTYLHRMGRAGRYGSTGVCINLVSQGAELEKIQDIINTVEGSSLPITEFPNISNNLPDLMDIKNMFSKEYVFQTPNVDSSEFQTYHSDLNRFSEDVFETTTNDSLVEVQTNHSDLNIQDSKTPRSDLKLSNQTQEGSLVHLLNCALNHNTMESHISKILNKTKTETDIIKKEMYNEDADNLLKSLISGECKENMYTSVSDNLCSSELQQLILYNTYESSEITHKKESENVEHGGPTRNFSPKEILFHKNTALLCVSTIIFDNIHNDKVHNNLECIQMYLNMLKEGERKESQNPVSNTYDNQIIIQKEIEPQKTLEDANSVADNLESIFKKGYDFATKPVSRHWNSYFPDSQTNLQDCAITEQAVDNADSFNIKEVLSLNDFVLSENVLEHSMENIKRCPVTQTNDVPNSEYHIADWEHFYKYFNNCSEYLWKKGLSFENVEDFDYWFYYEWQMNVSRVRDYVQQNIYHQEINKYQDSKTINLI